MGTFYALVRHFKGKFSFVDELSFDDKEKAWKVAWPSYVAPLRFFAEEGVYRIHAQKDKNRIWVFRAEKARIKVSKLKVSCEQTTAILWCIVSSIKTKELQVDELVVQGGEEYIATVEKLNLPCRVVFLA